VTRSIAPCRSRALDSRHESVLGPVDIRLPCMAATADEHGGEPSAHDRFADTVEHEGLAVAQGDEWYVVFDVVVD
jgi:hypothetical protein